MGYTDKKSVLESFSIGRGLRSSAIYFKQLKFQRIPNKHSFKNTAITDLKHCLQLFCDKDLLAPQAKNGWDHYYGATFEMLLSKVESMFYEEVWDYDTFQTLLFTNLRSLEATQPFWCPTSHQSVHTYYAESVKNLVESMKLQESVPPLEVCRHYNFTIGEIMWAIRHYISIEGNALSEKSIGDGIVEAINSLVAYFDRSTLAEDARDEIYLILTGIFANIRGCKLSANHPSALTYHN